MHKYAVIPFLLASMSTALSPSQAIAQGQDAQKDEITRMLASVATECQGYGRVVAEARLSKWKKKGEDISRAFGDNAFEVVSKVMQQQCVSVNTVLILRHAKSAISAEEALKMNVDAEISKHLAIIERTL